MNFKTQRIIDGFLVEFESILMWDGKCVMVVVESKAIQPAANWMDAWAMAKTMVANIRQFSLARAKQRQHGMRGQRRVQLPFVPLMPVCVVYQVALGTKGAANDERIAA